MRSNHWFSALLLSTAVLTAQVSHAQSSAPTDDLALQFKMSEKNMDWFMSKTRLMMNQVTNGDIMSGSKTFTAPYTYAVKDLMKDQTKLLSFVDVASRLFHPLHDPKLKLDFLNSQFVLKVPEVGYKIDKVQILPGAVKVDGTNLDLNADIQVSGIELSLPQTLAVEYQVPDSAGAMHTFINATIDPMSIVIPSTLDPLKVGIKINTVQTGNNQLNFKVGSDGNTDEISDYFRKNVPAYQLVRHSDQKVMNDLDLTKLINFSTLTFSFGSLHKDISYDEFVPIISDHLHAYLLTFINSISDELKGSVGKTISDAVYASTATSSYQFAMSELYTRFGLSRYTTPAPNQVSFGISGDLCTLDAYAKQKDACLVESQKIPPIRILSDATHAAGIAEMSAKLESGEQDIALSASEEYLNRLVRTTIDAGLWNDSLKEYDLKLGSRGAFLVFNSKTGTPDVYLDLLYYGEGLAQFALNLKNSPLHFPIKMSASAKFVNNLKTNSPHLILTTVQAETSLKEIEKGIPDYQLNSHLRMGLSGFIAKIIAKLSTKLNGQTVLDLDLPFLIGTGAEKAVFDYSPNGRLNLYLKD